MAEEKLYVKNGKVRTVKAISVVIDGIRYTNPSEALAAKNGYDSLDALLAAFGWLVYAPEEVAVTLESAIASKVAEIEAYNDSSIVKSISVNGEATWFDATERASMKNLYEAQKKAEQTSTTMWVNGKAYTLIPIDEAIGMLEQIEIYAGAIHNVTQSHIAYVKESKSVAEAEGFDVSEGYPETLSFSL